MGVIRFLKLIQSGKYRDNYLKFIRKMFIQEVIMIVILGELPHIQHIIIIVTYIKVILRERLETTLEEVKCLEHIIKGGSPIDKIVNYTIYNICRSLYAYLFGYILY